jgi:hypothetical protein
MDHMMDVYAFDFLMARLTKTKAKETEIEIEIECNT